MLSELLFKTWFPITFTYLSFDHAAVAVASRDDERSYTSVVGDVFVVVLAVCS